MGVTLYCKKTGASVDMTYAGFKRFRQLVSERCGPSGPGTMKSC